MQFQSFDESYVERLRAGDFRTQEHFVAYFSELLQLKLRSRLHSPQAIEDVRQETFARVLAALRGSKIRQPERLGAYVNSMCNNVLLEHYRASQRDSSIEDEEDQDFFHQAFVASAVKGSGVNGPCWSKSASRSSAALSGLEGRESDFWGRAMTQL